MELRKALSIVGLIAVLLVLTVVQPSSVSASPQVFAAFNGSSTFTYTNSGPTSTFTATPVSVSDFSFSEPTSISPANVPIANVFLTIAGTVSGPVVVEGPTDYQPFSSLTFTFSQGNGPVTTANTLLTAQVTGTYLAFGGTNGSVILTANPQTTDGEVFDYSSQYLVFPAQSPASLNVTFNPVSPSISIDRTPGADYGYLNSFTAPATGQFAVSPTPTGLVPEPDPLATLSIAALGLLGLLIIRKKSTADSI